MGSLLFGSKANSVAKFFAWFIIVSAILFWLSFYLNSHIGISFTESQAIIFFEYLSSTCWAIFGCIVIVFLFKLFFSKRVVHTTTNHIGSEQPGQVRNIVLEGLEGKTHIIDPTQTGDYTHAHLKRIANENSQYWAFWKQINAIYCRAPFKGSEFNKVRTFTLGMMRKTKDKDNSEDKSPVVHF